MKRHRVFWTRHARSDLHSIVEYILRENPENARKILKAIRKKVDQLASLPQRGRKVAELEGFLLDFYRETVLPPWRILYRIFDKEVIVMGVFDGRRDLQSLLPQRASSLRN